MERSLSCGSGSNTNSGGTSLMIADVLCLCGKSSVVKKSWTDENTGRKFYGCEAKWNSCNFFCWFDAERPHGWQKRPLLKARDIIRDQCDELKKLRDVVRETNSEENQSKLRVHEDEVCSKLENLNKKLKEEIAALESDNRKMKQEITTLIAKEKLLGKFVMVSWVGFVCVTAVIVNALK